MIRNIRQGREIDPSETEVPVDGNEELYRLLTQRKEKENEPHRQNGHQGVACV